MEHIFNCKVCGTRLGLMYTNELNSFIVTIANQLIEYPYIHGHCINHCSTESQHLEEHIDCDGWVTLKGEGVNASRKEVLWLFGNWCTYCGAFHGIRITTKGMITSIVDSAITKGLQIFMNDEKVRGICINCKEWFSPAVNLKVNHLKEEEK